MHDAVINLFSNFGKQIAAMRICWSSKSYTVGQNHLRYTTIKSREMIFAAAIVFPVRSAIRI